MSFHLSLGLAFQINLELPTKLENVIKRDKMNNLTIYPYSKAI